jgi:zona occludens toxin (predicted ATPase)
MNLRMISIIPNQYQDADQFSTDEKYEWYSKEQHHKRHIISTQLFFSESGSAISTIIEKVVKIFKNTHIKKL